MRFVWRSLFVLVNTLSVLSQQPWYEVSSFISDTTSFPVSGSSIIKPYTGNNLTQIREMPILESDGLLLRRRFSPGEYGLYIGKKDIATFENLSVFEPASGMTADMFIQRKLYLQETENPNMDIANVFFDNEHIFVENAAKLFFFEKEWQVLTLAKQMGNRLTVISYPESASVFIDGIKRGITPVTIKNLSTPFFMMSIKKREYYILDFFISMENRIELSKEFVLSPLPDAVKGTYIDPDTYISENKESVEALDAQIKELEKRIRFQKKENADSIDQFEKNYPPFQEQGEFEKTADFLKRKDVYQRKKANDKVELVSRGSPKVIELEESLMRLTTYWTQMENRLYHRYFPTDVIQLSRYEPDLGYFPVDIKINARGHSFTFAGILEIPISKAPDLKNNLSQGLLKLTYRNRILRQGGDLDTIKIFYEYTKFSLLFKGGEYTLEGKCKFLHKPYKEKIEEPMAGSSEDEKENP